MKINILIFGKNGQVASNLVRLFAEENRLTNNFNVQAYSSADIDFTNLLALENFLNNLSIQPDFIINAAAYTNVDKAEDERELADLINHQAVEVIARYCAQNQVKLIHYSTDYVFDGSGTEPFAEDNTKNLHPLNHYGKTKLLGEQVIIKSGCDYVIFRISWIYDSNPSSKNFLNTITRLAKEKEVLSIINDQFGSPTSASFVAENTIKFIKKSLNSHTKFPSGIYHLNNGKYTSWYDFALQIVSDLKMKGENLMVKEILPIKTFEYKTKAVRPLNSRLGTKFLNHN
ncbi:MAG: dTDP-4-dehydrorhamnose reductase [Pseudomonadota bacterium]